MADSKMFNQDGHLLTIRSVADLTSLRGECLKNSIGPMELKTIIVRVERLAY